MTDILKEMVAVALDEYEAELLEADVMYEDGDYRVNSIYEEGDLMDVDTFMSQCEVVFTRSFNQAI